MGPSPRAARHAATGSIPAPELREALYSSSGNSSRGLANDSVPTASAAIHSHTLVAGAIVGPKALAPTISRLKTSDRVSV